MEAPAPAAAAAEAAAAEADEAAGEAEAAAMMDETDAAEAGEAEAEEAAEATWEAPRRYSRRTRSWTVCTVARQASSSAARASSEPTSACIEAAARACMHAYACTHRPAT